MTKDDQIKARDAVIAELVSVLNECSDYFDDRSDADCDQDGYIPNDEMKLSQSVDDALTSAKALMEGE